MKGCHLETLKVKTNSGSSLGIPAAVSLFRADRRVETAEAEVPPAPRLLK
jgi:hypothetical protein